MEYRSASRTPISRPGSRLFTPTVEDVPRTPKNNTRPAAAKSSFYHNISKQANPPRNEVESQYVGLFADQDQAFTFIYKTARRVIICHTWMQIIMQFKRKLERQVRTFYDLANELEEQTTYKSMEENKLEFDPKYFQAKKEISLPYDVKYALTLISNARTPEMIQRILHGLQRLDAYSDYPLHLQERLARVAWFMEVTPKRLILKEGHSAENFYFILSGVAAVTKKKLGPYGYENETVGRLVRGQSFGEVALLHHSKRTASIESVSKMNLLVIARDDFLDIFYSSKDDNEPEHLKFCRTISWMKTWPIHLMMEHPKECIFHYFKRGTVVVPDSLKNEFVILVKSGNCVVMKNLMAAKPKIVKQIPPSSSQLFLPRLGIAEQRPRIDSRLSSSKTCNTARKSKLCNIDVFLNKLDESETSREGSFSSNFKVRPDTAPDINLSSNSTQPGMSNSKFSQNRPGGSRSGHTKIGMSSGKHYKFVSEFDEKIPSNMIWVPLERADDDATVVVQLKKLRPGDAFGLENIELENEQRTDDPKVSVTLVSNGAELIMIGRHFFQKHMDEHIKRYLREQIRPYPSNDRLQANLQVEINWENHRKSAVQNLLDSIKKY